VWCHLKPFEAALKLSFGPEVPLKLYGENPGVFSPKPSISFRLKKERHLG